MLAQVGSGHVTYGPSRRLDSLSLFENGARKDPQAGGGTTAGRAQVMPTSCTWHAGDRQRPRHSQSAVRGGRERACPVARPPMILRRRRHAQHVDNHDIADDNDRRRTTTRSRRQPRQHRRQRPSPPRRPRRPEQIQPRASAPVLSEHQRPPSPQQSGTECQFHLWEHSERNRRWPQHDRVHVRRKLVHRQHRNLPIRSPRSLRATECWASKQFVVPEYPYWLRLHGRRNLVAYRHPDGYFNHGRYREHSEDG